MKKREETELNPNPAASGGSPSAAPGVLILIGAYVISAAGLLWHLLSSGRGAYSAVGALTMLLMAHAAFGLYLVLKHRDLVSGVKQILFISVVMVLMELTGIVTARIDAGFTPALLAVLLIAIMANEKAAMLAALPLAVTAGIVSATGGFSTSAPAASAFAVLISSLTATYALHMRKTRASTVVAAFLAGIAGVVTFTAAMLFSGELFTDYWASLLWLLGSCIVCGVLTVGLMPIFESIFDIASEARLNELMSNDNKLLKRLMTEAPGTYHHSLLTAALAEAAAESIGADALLTRTAAMFHDVGKLRCPACFKENQRGANMHDELDPYESAKRIIAHQQDGVTLLEKAKFPKDVIRIVGRHHGDSVMVYFYNKAVKQAKEGEKVDESLFRYPAKKPDTKEAAILLLADCCEAAVRSMNNPTNEEIGAKVREVITHKWDKRGSMLWDSPLSFVEIKKIEESFLETFSALRHERVEYPDLEEIDVR